MRSAAVFVLLALLGMMGSKVRADWFDDIVEGLHEKLVDGADFLKEKAAPAVRAKFNEAKETLQDPETHRKLRLWVTEKAIPVVKEKLNKAGEFVQNEVLPEVKKIAAAYAEASEHDRSTTEAPIDEATTTEH